MSVYIISDNLLMLVIMSNDVYIISTVLMSNPVWLLRNCLLLVSCDRRQHFVELFNYSV